MPGRSWIYGSGSDHRRRKLIAHTCVEATVRFAAELGYEVTMAKDATADYSDEEMYTALDVEISLTTPVPLCVANLKAPEPEGAGHEQYLK